MKGQFIFGSVVAALGQSYINLAFTAFIVSWTIAAARRDDVIGLALWPFAFLAVFIPTHLNLIRARIEARKMEHANAQTEALHLTYIVTLIGFFVFAFVPVVIKAGWGWVPLVPK